MCERKREMRGVEERKRKGREGKGEIEERRATNRGNTSLFTIIF